MVKTKNRSKILLACNLATYALNNTSIIFIFERFEDTAYGVLVTFSGLWNFTNIKQSHALEHEISMQTQCNESKE